MEEEEEYMKCICCNKKQEVLISVEMEKFSIFLQRRGVCQVCLKNEDINKVCINYEIRKTKQEIKEREDSLSEMMKHLIELQREGE